MAAGVLLYMAAENADIFIRTRHPIFLIAMVALTVGAVHESYKVGFRTEHILGLTREGQLEL